MRFGLVASCVAGVDADQVVESAARFEGRVRRVAAVRETLVVVRVGEGASVRHVFLLASNGHMPIESNMRQGKKVER